MNRKSIGYKRIVKILSLWYIQAILVFIVAILLIKFSNDKNNKCVGYYTVGKALKYKSGSYLKSYITIEYFDFNDKATKTFNQLNSFNSNKKILTKDRYFLVKVCPESEEPIAFLNTNLPSSCYGKQIKSDRKMTFLESIGWY